MCFYTHSFRLYGVTAPEFSSGRGAALGGRHGCGARQAVRRLRSSHSSACPPRPAHNSGTRTLASRGTTQRLQDASGALRASAAAWSLLRVLIPAPNSCLGPLSPARPAGPSIHPATHTPPARAVTLSPRPRSDPFPRAPLRAPVGPDCVCPPSPNSSLRSAPGPASAQRHTSPNPTPHPAPRHPDPCSP